MEEVLPSFRSIQVTVVVNKRNCQWISQFASCTGRMLILPEAEGQEGFSRVQRVASSGRAVSGNSG